MSLRHPPASLDPDGPAVARPVARAWLALAVGAFALSALCALLLVLSRTPPIAQWLPDHGFFHTALVLHVDLAVLVWFLAFGGLLWSLAGDPRADGLGWWAWALVCAGAALLVVTPFLGGGVPVMSNYVPVIAHPLFYTGLTLLAGGAVLATSRALLDGRAALWQRDPRRLALGAAALAYAAALAVFLATYLMHPPGAGGLADHETLFWAGGHVLQFGHVLLMAAAWLYLGAAKAGPLAARPWLVPGLLAGMTLPALIAPAVLWLHPPGSDTYRMAFTTLMALGGWLGAVPFAMLALASAAGRGGGALAVRLSALLFLAGTAAAMLIRGDSLLVPAHYHGAIGAVTLAYMGLTWRLLPRLGLQPPAPRLARLQIRLYGGGLLLLVAGLTWAGYLGVARKTPGGEQVLDGAAALGMGLAGTGGLVALGGAITYVALALRGLVPTGGSLAPSGTVEQAER